MEEGVHGGMVTRWLRQQNLLLSRGEAGNDLRRCMGFGVKPYPGYLSATLDVQESEVNGDSTKVFHHGSFARYSSVLNQLHLLNPFNTRVWHSALSTRSLRRKGHWFPLIGDRRSQSNAGKTLRLADALPQNAVGEEG